MTKPIDLQYHARREAGRLLRLLGLKQLLQFKSEEELADIFKISVISVRKFSKREYDYQLETRNEILPVMDEIEELSVEAQGAWMDSLERKYYKTKILFK